MAADESSDSPKALEEYQAAVQFFLLHLRKEEDAQTRDKLSLKV